MTDSKNNGKSLVCTPAMMTPDVVEIEDARVNVFMKENATCRAHYKHMRAAAGPLYASKKPKAGPTTTDAF